MIPPRRHAIPIALAALVTLAPPAGAAGRDFRVDRKTRPDTEVLVRGFAPYDANCHAMRLPTISVGQEPANGEVEQRPGKVRIESNWVGDVSCVGTLLEGVQVWYRPHPGFLGHDHFTMTVDYPGKLGRANAQVDIEVTPDAPAPRAGAH